MVGVNINDRWVMDRISKNSSSFQGWIDDLMKTVEIDIENTQQEIEKAKVLIAERETAIIDNVKAQETKRQQIEIQNEIIKTISDKRRKLDL